ncbi:hypothetical protein RHSIM_Rhsim11G0157700 [Rhododendron simsii]|uniref:BED-type domain-containing protein n=1 Tax=Rhododendron simsii TaxID=118357 RepID=A0A834FZS1_RHOSS|nr:hypothetical protein RHSIM_Rhsim13G0133500 [Rhododendron simsii]KAF7126824.1 hypothetical protein RHSIM_Rhsim11G0157700 [Rhododendron simsii]
MILSVCCYIVPTATEPLSRMGDSYSGSSDEVARNPIAPQGMGSVGEEGASNIVGGGSGPSGTGPLGSTATPAASTPAATNSGLSGSKRSRRRSWVWNHFSIVDNFKNEKGIDIGQRAVCHYCDTNYKCLSNNGVGPHGRHLEKHHPDKIANASCSNFVYSKEKMRHGLALYVAAAEQPFTFGDDIRFEHFVKNCLNPSFVKVSRNSTRSDTKKAHSEVKKDLISELATVGAIGFTSDMWSDMEGKFRKYYEEMPPIFMLAAVMDPRMKLQGVSLVLRTIGTNLGITTLPSSAHVYDLLTTMYAKYDSKFRSNAVCTAAPLTSSTSTNDEFWNFVSSNLGSSTVTSRIELDKYLDLESVDENDRRDFDVLDWWKKNEVKYPVLSIMARDLLTPPVSTVASESAFSAGKRVLDERRSRLAPDILDCLICLKDWEDARLGIQKRSAKDEFRGYFADSDIDSD